ncbi:MAG: glycosyltransferase family 2 protein [Bacteroidaceae bacterium]
MKISVIILNWNGSAMLKKMLPSVVHYSQEESTEVCVADNCSTDDSVSMLRRDFPTVRLILLDKNYGFAGGYNLAIKQVEAEYIVLLNSDVEVAESWLQPLLHYMDTHLEIAACQPKIRSFVFKDKFEYAGAAGGFIDRYGYPFCRGRIMGDVENDSGQYDTIVPVLWASGAALFIRREDYLNAGGLDARFFAHMEEIDLCWRLRNRGRGVVCIPQSMVFHIGAATLKKENPQKTFLNFRNNLIMLYKNLPAKKLKRVMRVRVVLDYIAALSFLFTGNFKGFKAVLQARKAYCKLRPSFLPSRQENIKKTVVHHIPECKNYSILWKYYAKHQKTFDQIL